MVGAAAPLVLLSAAVAVACVHSGLLALNAGLGLALALVRVEVGKAERRDVDARPRHWRYMPPRNTRTRRDGVMGSVKRLFEGDDGKWVEQSEDGMHEEKNW